MRQVFTFLSIVFGLAFIGVNSAEAQAIPIDTRFGDNGFVKDITFPGYLPQEAGKILTLPDGRFIITVRLNNGVPNDGSIGVMRYSSNGVLDTTFGDDGYVLIDWSAGWQDIPHEIVLDRLGRIVIVGQAGVSIEQIDSALTILDAAGNQVVQRVYETNPEQQYFTDVTVDSSNQLILTEFNGSSPQLRLRRLNPDTNIFDPNINFTANDSQTALELDNLGRIVWAHSTFTENSSTPVTVKRILPNGTYDTSFSGDGIFTDTVGYSVRLHYVMIQSDNRIVLAGTRYTGGLPDGFYAWRYKDTGIDTVFGNSGYEVVGVVKEMRGASLDSQDRIIMGGYSFSTSYDFSVARLSADGKYETTFPTKHIDFGGESSDLGYDVAVMPNGDVISVGKSGTPQAPAMVRLDVSSSTLISNGGFETADAAQASGASKWVGTNLSNDKRNCVQVDAHSGKCSFIFRGSATEKAVITQTIKAPVAYKTAGTGLVLAAWVRGTPNVVLAKVVISYSDGSTDAFSAVFGPSATYEYFTSAPFFLAKNAKQFKVSFRHFGVGDKLYLDDVALLPNGARFVGDVLPLPPPPTQAFRGG